MKKYLKIFLLLLTALILLPSERPCFAASAKVEIVADNTEVTVGDKVKVYINISSDNEFGDFEANLTYDKDILKYKSGASVISGGNGYLKISDLNNTETVTSRKYALEFEALKVGDCELAYDGQVMVYDDSGLDMPVSSNSLTITVKPQKTASSDASLKTLETSPADLIPAFDKNVHEYNIKVDSDTQRLVITAVPDDDKAKVTITGNDSLKEGENKIIIEVLAESGDGIEYTINAYREAAPTVTAAPTEIPETASDSTVTFTQSDGDTYAVVNGRYRLIEPGSDITIPKGYTKTDLTISGITINAYVPESDPESDFVLIYAENSSGETGFYKYDKAENTLQRYTENTSNTDKYRSDLNRAAIIIAVLSAFSLLLLIALGYMFIKYRRFKKR